MQKFEARMINSLYSEFLKLVEPIQLTPRSRFKLELLLTHEEVSVAILPECPDS